MTGMYATLQFQLERMAESADSPYAAATDLAELLVRNGMPFRDAHAVVGALVRTSIDNKVDLSELVQAEPLLGDAGVALLQPGVSVQQRSTPGGAGPIPVAIQRVQLGEQIQAERARWSFGE
jgi:argininosuccinate lyase